MGEVQELIEEPLSGAELAARYRALCDDPCYANVPFVADVAWASARFMSAHGGDTPLTRAPEICIEVVSPSNSVKELREKTQAFLSAGAEEVWIVYAQSRRCEFYGKAGLLRRSAYAVDLAGLFA